jgi:hypothetical protein
VSMFISARRPFLAELSLVARRRGVDAARVGELYDTSTGLLDRLLLAFVAAHEVTALEVASVAAGTAAEAAHDRLDGVEPDRVAAVPADPE